MTAKQKQKPKPDFLTTAIYLTNHSRLLEPSGTGMELNDGSKDQAGMEENQQATLEFESEREEGELLPDVADVGEGADLSNMTGSPDIAEGLPDVGTTPEASPARIDDEALVATGVELGEINSPEILTEEKNDEGDALEETLEGSDKSNDGNDQVNPETDQIPEPASVTVESSAPGANAESDVSKPASSGIAEAEEVKPVSPASSSSTVVNLAERAKERAMLRQSGAGVLFPPGSRGRARGVRGRGTRGARGGRSGRGQTPGQQG